MKRVYCITLKTIKKSHDEDYDDNDDGFIEMIEIIIRGKVCLAIKYLYLYITVN